MQRNKFTDTLLPLVKEADRYLDNLNDVDFDRAITSLCQATGVTAEECFDGLLATVKPTIEIRMVA